MYHINTASSEISVQITLSADPRKIVLALSHNFLFALLFVAADGRQKGASTLFPILVEITLLGLASKKWGRNDFSNTQCKVA